MVLEKDRLVIMDRVLANPISLPTPAEQRRPGFSSAWLVPYRHQKSGRLSGCVNVCVSPGRLVSMGGLGSLTGLDVQVVSSPSERNDGTLAPQISWDGLPGTLTMFNPYAEIHAISGVWKPFYCGSSPVALRRLFWVEDVYILDAYRDLLL